MTARDALNAAKDLGLQERTIRFKKRCAPPDACRREPLADDAGRWSWCPDCLTLYDDYGKPVNGIQSLRHRPG